MSKIYYNLLFRKLLREVFLFVSRLIVLTWSQIVIKLTIIKLMYSETYTTYFIIYH